MSNTTNEINRVTGVIIRVSLRLIIYALIVLLLYEGVMTGYTFGYSIFAGKAVSPEPGITMSVTVEEGDSLSQVGQMLKEDGLIENEYVFIIQAYFYDYEIYPGTYSLSTAQTSREMLEEMSVPPAAETETSSGETDSEREAGSEEEIGQETEGGAQ